MRYLAILNQRQYPNGDTDDWRGTYATPEEAQATVDLWEAKAPGYNYGSVVDLQAWIDRSY